MKKIRNRKKLRKRTKLQIQKNIVILFILALILSPFGSLGSQVYANEEDIVEASEELAKEQTEIVDKAALEDKLTDIDEADLTEADYTDSSWETLQEALTAAESVLADDDAMQDAVDDSLVTLTEDYDALKEVEEPTEENKPAAEDDSEEDEADVSEEDEATNDKEESKVNETDSEDDALKNNKMKLKMQPLAISGEYEYDAIFDGTVTITGYNGSDKDITIPNQLNGKDVTGINDGVFKAKELRSVIIPDNVTKIGFEAFADNYLTSINIPNITTLGDAAFDKNRLTSIVIPDSLNRIGKRAFYRNQLTNVVIPDGISEIGNGAFSDNYLTSIDLPDSVTRIGGEAFSFNDLTSIDISNNVTMLGWGAFSSNQLTSVTIPTSITKIDRGTFVNNQLTSVDLPDTITGISNYAFADNYLTSIDLPDSVTIIGNEAFKNNDLTSVNLPESVTKIWGGAFAFNSLTDVTIHNTQTEFKIGVFDGNQVTSTDLILHGYSPSTTEDYAAHHSYTFSDLDPADPANKSALDAKFTEIDDAGLTEADYTDTSWGTLQDALRGAELIIDDDDATQDEVNDSLAALIAAYEGLENPDSPESDYEWSDNGDGTVTITKYTGSDTDLKIPAQLDGKDVTGIGKFVFMDKNLTRVVIPDSVIKIGMTAFGDNKLTSIDIPDGVTEIGGSAFAGNKLTSIDIPDSVTEIKRWAFGGNQLTSLDIPKGITEIGSYTFARNQLTSVVIPEYITKIGWQAFEGNKLTDVTIYNPEVEFDEEAFAFNQENSKDLTIHGYISSTSEAFANKHGYTFKAIDESSDSDDEPKESDDKPTKSEDPSDEEKSKDSVIVAGDQFGSDDDSDKDGLSVGISDEDGTVLPMTATSFYTLIFGGLLLTIFGIATFIIFRVRQRNN